MLTPTEMLKAVCAEAERVRQKELKAHQAVVLQINEILALPAENFTELPVWFNLTSPLSDNSRPKVIRRSDGSKKFCIYETGMKEFKNAMNEVLIGLNNMDQLHEYYLDNGSDASSIHVGVRPRQGVIVPLLSSQHPN